MGIFQSIAKDATSIVNNASAILSDPKKLINGVLKPPLGVAATDGQAKDMRTILRVPDYFLNTLEDKPSQVSDTGQIVVTGINDPLASFKELGGIIFPYTPTISVENRAEYSGQNVTHSNYTQFFYKYSSVGPIRISGKFTVQNEAEGMVLLATIHMLRALSKMPFGTDENAGAPPPICRLDAYGDYMLHNIPVSLASWTHELPDNVDYITVGRSSPIFGYTSVPVLSTISMDLNVMYSRREMMGYNVSDWLRGNLQGKGYL